MLYLTNDAQGITPSAFLHAPTRASSQVIDQMRPEAYKAMLLAWRHTLPDDELSHADALIARLNKAFENQLAWQTMRRKNFASFISNFVHLRGYRLSSLSA